MNFQLSEYLCNYYRLCNHYCLASQAQTRSGAQQLMRQTPVGLQCLVKHKEGLKIQAEQIKFSFCLLDYSHVVHGAALSCFWHNRLSWFHTYHLLSFSLRNNRRWNKRSPELHEHQSALASVTQYSIVMNLPQNNSFSNLISSSHKLQRTPWDCDKALHSYQHYCVQEFEFKKNIIGFT